jgi:hypothetical protein
VDIVLVAEMSEITFLVTRLMLVTPLAELLKRWKGTRNQLLLSIVSNFQTTVTDLHAQSVRLKRRQFSRQCYERQRSAFCLAREMSNEALSMKISVS